jgi:carboxypeptidase PM20D1
LKLPANELERITVRFAETVKFPTISAHGDFSLAPFHEMRSYSACVWREVFSVLDVELHGGASILLRWAGTDPFLKPFMLTAHQDVVPPGCVESWTRDPFSGEISENRIWGRGTIDYKCGYAGMLEACSILLGNGFKPRRTVLFAFGHDEEAGGRSGAGSITESLRNRGILCSSVLDEGGYIYTLPDTGDEAVIAVAEKGYASFRLVAEAVQCHSAVPPLSTAIGILARGLVALEHLVFPQVPFNCGEILDSRWLRTTLAPTVITGGCKENVLPGRAEAIVNTRPAPGSSVAEVFNVIKSTVESLGIRVEPVCNASLSEPSAISSTETKDFNKLKASVLNTIKAGTRISCGCFPAATDSRRYSMIAENVYRFLPVHLGAQGIGALHSVDESISVDDYFACVRFYADYIAKVSEAL